MGVISGEKLDRDLIESIKKVAETRDRTRDI